MPRRVVRPWVGPGQPAQRDGRDLVPVRRRLHDSGALGGGRGGGGATYPTPSRNALPSSRTPSTRPPFPLPSVFSQLGDHWFFTPGDGVHPLADLIGVYHASVGSNGHLEIDFAIDRTGGIAPTHAAAYRTFGNWIRNCYGTPLATGSMAPGANSLIVTLPGGTSGSTIDRVSMAENQTNGQNVITYVVEYTAVGSSMWIPFSSGTTIGSKRIDLISDGSLGPVSATSVRLTVTSAYSSTLPVTLSVFSPAGCQVTE